MPRAPEPVAAALGSVQPQSRLAGAEAGGHQRPRHALSQRGAAIAGLTVLAFALAYHQLGSKSLWLDEATSASYARLGLSGVWHVVDGGDPNMGLYYVLLHFWTQIFGDNEVSLRSLSAVCGTLSVPAIVLLGEQLLSRRAGLMAGLLLAVNPFLIHYEQTVRSYSLLVLLVTLSAYFFVRELDRPSRATRAGYVLASAAAVHAQYFAAYVLLVQLLTLIALRRRELTTREMWLSLGAVAALCAPEFVLALHKGGGGISWIPTPTLTTLTQFPSQLTGSASIAVMALILVCLAVIRRGWARDRWRVDFLLTWLLLPVVLTFAVSKLGRPLWEPFYLIMVLPAFILLAAAGLVTLPSRWAGAVAVGLLVLSAASVASWYGAPSKEGYRGATRYVLAHEASGDVATYDPAYIDVGLAYYADQAERRLPATVAMRLAAHPAQHLSRLWLVIRGHDVAGPQRELQRSVERHYELVTRQSRFPYLTVLLYRVR